MGPRVRVTNDEAYEVFPLLNECIASTYVRIQYSVEVSRVEMTVKAHHSTSLCKQRSKDCLPLSSV